MSDKKKQSGVASALGSMFIGLAAFALKALADVFANKDGTNEKSRKPSSDTYTDDFYEAESEPDEEEELVHSNSNSNNPFLGFPKRAIPKVCQICGGPYPMCEDGCAMFDD